MYNIYIEEKKKRDLENKKKEELKLLKYKEKFQSKFKIIIFIFHRTNSNYVSKL